MSNPYFWDFPHRADTMYMSTIGIYSLTQKTNQDPGGGQADNPPSRKRISKGPTLNNKSPKK